MSDKQIIKATYSDYKRVLGRKVLQLICEVPLEEAPHVHDTFGEPGIHDGAVWVAIAKLNPDAADKADQEPTEKPKRQMSHAQMAGILCNDKLFQAFVDSRFEDAPFQGAFNGDYADYVRLVCGVESRSELNTNAEAAKRWLDLKAEFEAWKLAP